jgi:uncharacterized damage-inducible protein DinB
MDILERLLGHDLWTTRQLLERCRPLTAEQLDRTFDVGHGSLRATWDHLIGNVETWTDLMSGGPLPEGHDEAAPTLPVLAARYGLAAARFGALARALSAEVRLDELWTDVLDNPPTRKSYGGAIVHVLTHSHAHRIEILHILARLGLTDLPEGDVLSWEAAAHNEQSK